MAETTCKICNGTGTIPGSESTDWGGSRTIKGCKVCNGTGKVQEILMPATTNTGCATQDCQFCGGGPGCPLQVETPPTEVST